MIILNNHQSFLAWRKRLKGLELEYRPGYVAAKLVYAAVLILAIIVPIVGGF